MERGVLSKFDNEGGCLGQFSNVFAKYTSAICAIPQATGMVVLAEAVSVSGAGTGIEILCDPIVQFGALAASYFNAVARFVDVDNDTYTMDQESLE